MNFDTAVMLDIHAAAGSMALTFMSVVIHAAAVFVKISMSESGSALTDACSSKLHQCQRIEM